MNLKVQRLEKLPEDLTKRSTNSQALEAVQLAMDEPGKPVEISGDEAEVQRFYKLMTQWRARHRDTALRGANLTIRKTKGALYIWIEQDRRQHD